MAAVAAVGHVWVGVGIVSGVGAGAAGGARAVAAGAAGGARAVE